MNIKRVLSPWWLLVAISLAGLAAPFAWQHMRHATVVREVGAQAASLRQSGHPGDVNSLLQQFRETASDEHTVAWLEWMYIAFEFRKIALSAGVLDRNSGELQVADPDSGGSWSDDPVLDVLLQQSEPVYERLKELCRHGDQVWLPWPPNADTGGLSPLGMIWEIQSFMLTRMSHAVDSRDAETAMEAFATHQAALDAFDWQLSVSVEVQLSKIFEQRDTIVIEAIEQGLFDADQINQLEQTIARPFDVRKRWRSVVAANQVVFLDQLRDQLEKDRSIVDSQRDDQSGDRRIARASLQQVLLGWDRIMDAADDGIENLQHNANTAASALSPVEQNELANRPQLAGIQGLENVASNVRGLARAMVLREASRKKTIRTMDRERKAK
ncbi:hypothetical protein [Allorhodopirellula solitaria]|uniref:Uncharacterized protein n=1 Tax=Allorhodopirellula solitaria TaxID=2527987 RepID=A0A5C5XQ73_9BACT|nr:hypothetical protein [Allorhodopirellula solitaria]TWT64739.1 hypothetical protein CA85_35240 [Allorhodopirellula solitaria]